MTPENPLSISVIVPVFNHWSLVPALLDALSRQSIGTDRFELLLVDNGSDHVPELRLPPWARLLHCATPGSYAARNLAVDAVHSPLLAFTDADCRPRPQWLAELIAQAAADDCRSLVAGGVVMEPQDWNAMTPSEVFDVVMGLPQQRYVSHGYAVTANLLIPAQAFRQVGPFDASRFSGGDAEFCRRAVSSGWRLRYCAAAEVVHPARREWHELCIKQRRVKGGQLTAGPLRRRWLYGLVTLLPPLRQCMFALRSGRLGMPQRLQVCVMLLRLWGVGLREMIRVLQGGRPERR